MPESWAILLPGLAAGAVAGLGLLGARELRGERLAEVDLAEAVDIPLARLRARRGLLDRLSARLVRRLRPLLPGPVLGWLQRQIDLAGRPDNLDVDAVLARAMVWVVITSPALLVFLLAGQWLGAVLIPVAVVVMPAAWLSGRARRRQEQIDRDLPDFLDVLAVTVSAGLGFRSALETVAGRFGGPVGDEVMTALHQITNGASVRSAFRGLRQRTESESVNEFVTAYLQAEELGAPLVETLGQIAADMRRAAAQRQRQKAARIAPRITLVMTSLMVPAALLLMVAGLMVGSGIDLGAIFGGR